jgi:hypothetical protein
MANELQCCDESGLDLYAVVLSATGTVWNGSAVGPVA